MPTGIAVQLTLNAAQFRQQLGVAGAQIQNFVTQTNALRINIPATINVAAWKQQAAQINQQIAQWQQGVNVPVKFNPNTGPRPTPGPGPGGRGWGGGGMRGVGRFLAPYAFIREAEQVVRNEGAYSEAKAAANTPEAAVEADVKHRKSYDSFAFGIGRLGRAVREAGPGEATTEDIERTLAETKYQEQQSARMQSALDHQRALNREVRTAMADPGYARHRESLDASTEAKKDALGREHKGEYGEVQKKFEADLYKINAEEDQYAEHHTQIPGTEDMRKPFEDRKAVLLADANKKGDAINKRFSENYAKLDAANKKELADIEHEADQHRDAANIEASADRELLRGDGKTDVEVRAARLRDAQKAKEYARTMRPDEAAAATAADTAKTDLQEKQGKGRQALEYGELEAGTDYARSMLGGDTDAARRDKRDRVNKLREDAELDAGKRSRMQAEHKAEGELEDDEVARRRGLEAAQSRVKVVDIGAEAEEGLTAARGDTEGAAKARLKRQLDDRVKALREQANAERDVVKSGQLSAEADAEEQAKPKQIQAQEIKFARENAERLTDIKESTNEAQLKSDDRYYEAAESARNSHYDKLVKLARESGHEEQAKALEGEKAAAQKESDARHDDEIKHINASAAAIGERALGHNASAGLIGLREEMRESEDKATGDPEKLKAVRAENQAKLREFIHGERTPATFTDFEGAYKSMQLSILNGGDDKSAARAKARGLLDPNDPANAALFGANKGGAAGGNAGGAGGGGLAHFDFGDIKDAGKDLKDAAAGLKGMPIGVIRS